MFGTVMAMHITIRNMSQLVGWLLLVDAGAFLFLPGLKKAFETNFDYHDHLSGEAKLE